MARKTVFTKVYNEKIKDRFLNEDKGYSDASKNAFQKLFKRTGQLEYKYEKDLYDFSLEELKSYFYNLQSSSEATINSNKSMISKYKKWANKQGYPDSLIDVTKLIDYTEIANLTSKAKILTKYLSGTDELEDLLETAMNKQDGLIVLLLFYGISLQEMLGLYEKDIDWDNHSICVGERKVVIDKEFIPYVKDALRQSIYLVRPSTKEGKNENRVKDCELATQSPYVIKKAFKKADTIYEKLSLSGIMQRLKRTISDFDKPSLNAKNIIASGMYYELSKIEKNKELGKDDYILIRRRFNILDDANFNVTRLRYNEWKNAIIENEKFEKEQEEFEKAERQRKTQELKIQ